VIDQCILKVLVLFNLSVDLHWRLCPKGSLINEYLVRLVVISTLLEF
jgi:hypothetical protein